MGKKKSKTGLFGKKKHYSEQSKDVLSSNYYDSTNDFLVEDGVLKKYNGSETSVVIPSNLGIDQIGQRAFYKRTDVRSITIPNGIRSIANYAFSCCENLSDITIPDTVNFLGNYAFENCISLTSISLPDNLQSVGSYLFSGCSKLVDVKLPYELRTIGNYMFFKCTSLPTVKIPDKVTSIGWKAFSGCSGLNGLTIPKNVDTLGNNAFENCYKLSSINLTDNMTAIGEGVFFMCKSLKAINVESTNANYKTVDGVLYSYDEKVLITYPSKLNENTTYNIPPTVKTILYGAFSNCEKLEKIVIPESVEVIDNCAFFNCINLKEINITNNIKTLGKNAFNNCYNITEVILPDNIDNIETGLFSGCANLKKVQMSNSVKSIGEIAFFGCVHLENFDLPAELEMIGCAAFTNCQSLTLVNIHENIKTIARGAYSHCRNLTAICVEDNNPIYSSIDGVLYSKDAKNLLVYPAGRANPAFEIPSSVESINDQAFFGAIHIEDVIIPSSIEDIGLSAFSECPKLSKVTIENGLANIGTFVFSKNPNLSIVSLPRSVTSIDPSAFLECENVTFVCSQDSFAYKFASIKNIPLYSEKKNNFVANPDMDDKEKLGFLNKEEPAPEPEPKPEPAPEPEPEPEKPSITEIAPEPIVDIEMPPLQGTEDEETNTEPEPIPKPKEKTDTAPPVYDIPVVNTESFVSTPNNNTKEVVYMSDISDMFEGINELSAIESLNIPNTNYYINENNMKNPAFDNQVIFNGDPFDPLRGNADINSMEPNTDIGIQPEYSSPNKIKNVNIKQNSTSSVILTWDNYPDTSEYHLLHFNLKTKMYDDVCKLKTNKALLTGIIPSHIQQYKIIAYGTEKGKRVLIASSPAISVCTTLPPIENIKAISSTKDSITFSWEASSEASSYIVYAFNPIKNSYVPVDETAENFITFSNIEGITNLKIKVAGISIINGIECMTGLSEEVVGYTSIATVTGINVASVTSTSIKLSWPAITSIDVYKIYAYNDKTMRFEYVDTTPINQIVFNHLIPNKEYQFKIRAVTYIDDDEVMGAPSEIVVAKTTM